MTDKPKGVRVGPPVKDESEHFLVCKVCGQAFDMRDLEEAMHHIPKEHEPRRRDG
jgi:Fe2+ or Zn2+ uptake regulation protein